jgi:putative transposase
MTSSIHLVQRHSKNLLLAHVVWTTARRAPLLLPSVDAWLANELQRLAADAGGLLVACGNASDHVHVLIRYPSTSTLASVVQRLKGASSHAWNLRRSPHLSWQTGSWACSVSPGHLTAVVRYLERQRMHHAETTQPEAWERAPTP